MASTGWEILSAVPALAGDEVHVWRLPVPEGDDACAEWRGPLTEPEQARALRYHFPEDRRREWVSRGGLRRVLGGYLGLDPRAIRFEAGINGKPFLAESDPAARIEFNSSHSGDWVLLGLAPARAIGVDVERWRAVEADAIVADFFSPAEVEEWRALPSALRTAGFFSGWTRKEAYLKALGVGLMKPLSSFRVRVDPEAQAALLEDAEDPTAPLKWKMWAAPVPLGYSGAVVVDQARSAPKIRWLEFAALRPPSPWPHPSTVSG